MRTRPILFSSLALGLLFSGTGETSAQTAQLGVADGAAVKPAPALFDGAKRTLRVTKALQAAGLTAPSALPSGLEMKLSPMAPRHSSGAQIVRATSMSFYGPSSGKPDGTFVLTSPTDMDTPVSFFEISFPTVQGKMYVVDCRFTANNGGPLKLSVNNATSGIYDVEDGHLVVAFAAKAASSALTMVGGPTMKTRFGFYGCEMGRVD